MTISAPANKMPIEAVNSAKTPTKVSPANVKKKDRMLLMIVTFRAHNVGHIDELFKRPGCGRGLELDGKALQDKFMKTNDHSKPEKSAIRLLRSALSVPAINERAFGKLPGLDFDVAIFDLEDSVAPESKAEARFNLIEFLRHHRFSGRKTVIRVNDRHSEWFADDMAAVIATGPDAVLVPKVDDPRDLQFVADCLAENDVAHDMRIWAMMETPRGLLNAAAIAESARSNRLECFVVGLNDLRKETKVDLTPGRPHLVPWLMQVILAARAYGLGVLDSVNNDFQDLTSFAAECMQGRAMGFDGKMLIHPAQIGPANQHFGPTKTELEHAARIIAGFQKPESANLGVINLDGKMVERLHLEEARQLIAVQHQIISRGKAE